MIELIYAGTLPLELAALFAYWTWSRECRSIAWMLLAAGLLLGIATVLLITHNPFPNQLYAAYPGMLIFSWLSWTWWKENHSLDDWTFREAAMALLAAVAFAVARSGT